jgi:hypothetical protein
VAPVGVVPARTGTAIALLRSPGSDLTTLVLLNLRRRGALWRFDPREERELLVTAGEMRSLGLSRRTAMLFQEWIETAAGDASYPLHILSCEHYDDIGLLLWSRTISEVREDIPVAYRSIAGLGQLWEVPSPEWVAEQRALLRARWREGPGARPW